MKTIQRIAKNVGVLSVSQIIGYLLAFFYTIFIARYLGAEGFGTLSFAIAFTAILGILADLGLSTLIVREVARDKSLTNKFIGNIIIIKLILGILTFGTIAIIINLLNYPQQTVYVVYLIGLSVILASFFQMFFSVFQAHEKMEYQSIGNLLNNTLLFAGIFLGISRGFDVLGFAFIYFIASGIVLAYIIVICVWKFGFPKIEFDQSFLKMVIRQALPLSFIIILSTIYFRIDSVLLSLIQSEAAVGWYNAAYRFVELLLFIPGVYTMAIFPVISKLHSSSQNNLELLYKKSFEYLIILGLPIAGITTILADKIILLLFRSGFTESIFALQILIWAIPFMFLSYMASWIFISINKQYLLLKLALFGTIINIGLNVILIPKYSYLGSSLVTVISEIIGFTLYFYFLSIYISKIKIHNLIVKPAIATIITSLLIFQLNMNLFWSILISIITYFILLLLFKTFSREDFEIFRSIMK